MALDTFSNLKAALRSRSHRNDMPDARLEEFITLGEGDLWQRLRVTEMDTRATAASTTADRYLVKPDLFLQMRNLTLEDEEGNLYDVEYRTPKALGICKEAGRPRFYTVSSQLEFDRTPDVATYTYQMQYYKKPVALSDENTSNDVLINYPQLYYYACLVHLYDWTDNQENEAKYRALFENEVTQANEQGQKDEVGAVPTMTLRGSTP